MDSCWSDAFILNLSKRGMLVRASKAPARGSYLEICRGAHVIVARVVWSAPDRFGVRTQDPVPADELVLEPDGVQAPPQPVPARLPERRARPRSRDEKHEASRRKARSMQFGVVVAIGVAAAVLIADSIAGAFSAPLGVAEASLRR